jgi:hypothetical protein
MWLSSFYVSQSYKISIVAVLDFFLSSAFFAQPIVVSLASFDTFNFLSLEILSKIALRLSHVEELEKKWISRDSPKNCKGLRWIISLNNNSEKTACLVDQQKELYKLIVNQKDLVIGWISEDCWDAIEQHSSIQYHASHETISK